MKAEEVSPRVSQGPLAPDGLYFIKKNWVGFLSLHIVVTNVGRSPAMNVRVGAWPLYGSAQKIDLEKFEQKMCATLDGYPKAPQLMDNANQSAAMFPGDKLTVDEVALALYPKDMKSNMAWARGDSSFGSMGASGTCSQVPPCPTELGLRTGFPTLLMLPQPLGEGLWMLCSRPMRAFQRVASSLTTDQWLPELPTSPIQSMTATNAACASTARYSNATSRKWRLFVIGSRIGLFLS